MGTHPIFESDFDCLTVLMAIVVKRTKTDMNFDVVRDRDGNVDKSMTEKVMNYHEKGRLLQFAFYVLCLIAGVSVIWLLGNTVILSLENILTSWNVAFLIFAVLAFWIFKELRRYLVN